MHGVTLMWLVQDQARGQRMDTGYFVPVLSPRLKSRGPRRRMSRLGVRVREKGVREGWATANRAKQSYRWVPLASSARRVWCGVGWAPGRVVVRMF